jgi:hypothetical protein
MRQLLVSLCVVLFFIPVVAAAQQQPGFLAFDPYADDAFAKIEIELKAGDVPTFMALSMNQDGHLIVHNVGDGMAECYRVDKRSAPRLASSYLHIEPHHSSPSLFVPANSQGDWLCFSREGTFVTRDQQRGFEVRSAAE